MTHLHSLCPAKEATSKNETTDKDKGTRERCEQKIFKKLESHVGRVESLVPTKTKKEFFFRSLSFLFAHVAQPKKIKIIRERIFIHFFRRSRAHLSHVIFLLFLFEKKKVIIQSNKEQKILEEGSDSLKIHLMDVEFSWKKNSLMKWKLPNIFLVPYQNLIFVSPISY